MSFKGEKECAWIKLMLSMALKRCSKNVIVLNWKKLKLTHKTEQNYKVEVVIKIILFQYITTVLSCQLLYITVSLHYMPVLCETGRDSIYVNSDFVLTNTQLKKVQRFLKLCVT